MFVYSRTCPITELFWRPQHMSIVRPLNILYNFFCKSTCSRAIEHALWLEKICFRAWGVFYNPPTCSMALRHFLRSPDISRGHKTVIVMTTEQVVKLKINVRSGHWPWCMAIAHVLAIENDHGHTTSLNSEKNLRGCGACSLQHATWLCSIVGLVCVQFMIIEMLSGRSETPRRSTVAWQCVHASSVHLGNDTDGVLTCLKKLPVVRTCVFTRFHRFATLPSC